MNAIAKATSKIPEMAALPLGYTLGKNTTFEEWAIHGMRLRSPS